MLQEYQRGLRWGGGSWYLRFDVQGGWGGGVLFNSDPFGQIKKGRRRCKNWTVFMDVMNLWSQTAIKTNSSSFRFVQFRFVIKLLKRLHKNRLTFSYYSITFLDFQSVLKTLQVLKEKKLKKDAQVSKYRFYDLKSRFIVIFCVNYRHRLELKILFFGHIFPKISKYCTENLYFLSTSKYYVPLTKWFLVHIFSS